MRSAPVALSGAIRTGRRCLAVDHGGASLWNRGTSPATGWSVGILALLTGCAEIAWHYVTHASETDRRRSRQVLGQFLPALVAGAIATGALMRFGPGLTPLLPGPVGAPLWRRHLRGTTVRAARKRMGRAVLLDDWPDAPVVGAQHGHDDAWAVGGTFGVGQLLGAAVLYWNLERNGKS